MGMHVHRLRNLERALKAEPDTELPGVGLALVPVLGCPADHLTPEEGERARRFRSETARANFVSSRAAVRKVLGQVLGCAAADVPLVQDAEGRPWLEGACDLRLSWSHAGGHVLIGWRSGGAIGVDLETARPIAHDSMLALAASEREAAVIQALKPVDRHDAFLRLWTVKEAVLKAIGLGVRGGLKSVAVPDLLITGDADLETVHHVSSPYRVRLSRRDGHVAAVAIPDPASPDTSPAPQHLNRP